MYMLVYIIQGTNYKNKKQNINSVTNVFVRFRSRKQFLATTILSSDCDNIIQALPPHLPSSEHLNIRSALLHSDSSLIN